MFNFPEIVPRNVYECGSRGHEGELYVIILLDIRVWEGDTASQDKNFSEIAGRKISTGPDFKDWFLAMKPILGIRRTPEASQRKCPGSTQRALKELILWPEAMATRNAIFNVSRRRDALCNGSKGAEARTLRTAGKLQAGRSILEGGLFKKKDWNKRVRNLEFDTEETVAKASMT